MRIGKDVSRYTVCSTASQSYTSTAYKFPDTNPQTINNSLAFVTKSPTSRLSLRDWLRAHANQGNGVTYYNEDKNLFKIPWVHASKKNWDQSQHCKLFEEWAIYTGKQERNAKQWKANFRCALNSLNDVKEVKELSKKNGPDGFKVFRILENKMQLNEKKVLKRKLKNSASPQGSDCCSNTSSSSPSPSQIDDSPSTNEMSNQEGIIFCYDIADPDSNIDLNFDECYPYDIIGAHTEDVELTSSNIPSSLQDPMERIPIAVLEMRVDDDAGEDERAPRSSKRRKKF